mgnify:CR=1 FL=1
MILDQEVLNHLFHGHGEEASFPNREKGIKGRQYAHTLDEYHML